MNAPLQNQSWPDGGRVPTGASALARIGRCVIGIIAAVLACCFSPVHCGAAEASVLKEYQIKAAFLYNFTKFVEWPAERFPDTNAPIILGVAGSSPCTAELTTLVRGRRVNGRELVIRTVSAFETAKGVHVLFISSSEEPRLAEWCEAVRGAGILTVGESPTFIRRGGIINFLLEEEKIRFEINMEEAETAGLKISAQLQKLAKSVRRKSQP